MDNSSLQEFDEDFYDQNLEIGYSPEDSLDEDSQNENYDTVSQQRRPRRFVNPYGMNKHNVSRYHFKDARIYDPDIKESGWEIQPKIARKKYNDWVRSVRATPGWEGFHRAPRVVWQEFEDKDGNTYVFRKVVQPRVPGMGMAVARQNAGKNRRTNIVSQSRTRGGKPDDQDFRPKMFTSAMGREISRLRGLANLNQVDLARKINVDVNMIRNIELGGLITFNSEDVMVKALARALEVPSIKYQE